jgi:putative addiction module component (TIGR02574 family)
MTTLPDEVRRMSVTERIDLAQAIWDSVVAESPTSMLTETQRAELTQRLAHLEANPDDVVPWEEVRDAARARHRQ